MAKADSVYITPPPNTSAIDHPMMFPPRDPTRRRFLAVAAVGSIAGAGTLAAAAAMDPSVPPGHASGRTASSALRAKASAAKSAGSERPAPISSASPRSRGKP
jgi:hypothetical protein